MRYLDYAATTPLDASVLSAMQPYLTGTYGNPSSVHTFGRDARMAVERARQQVATVLGAQQKEIVFTSSASESNNLALKGVIEHMHSHNLREGDAPLEIVASPVEHPCVIEALGHIEKLGLARIVWLPVDSVGQVSPHDVESAITARTALVSVMYVNNEIGTIMPIREISEVISRVRKQRVASQNTLPLYFHSDAVQAIQYLDCTVDTLGVDLLSLSAHKVYGPKGTGVLYIRNGVKLTRQIDGGGQEYYLRAGTENVAGIVGAAEAFASVQTTRISESARLSVLQSELLSGVLSTIDGVLLTGSDQSRAPHITSFFFDSTDAEALIIGLDRAGFAVSSGSACSSGVVRQSHVIQALGLSPSQLKTGAALRISTGRFTTSEDIASFVSSLVSVVAQVRSLTF